tara:strand:+ start:117 stop:938 length:822 start_codon:yes stop_codon:yes gene_type:complete
MKLECRRIILLLTLFLVPLTWPALGSTQAPLADDALRVSQQAIGNMVGDHLLRAAGGETVRLSEFRGRPLVINLIYTACYHTCPVIVQTLAEAVEDARGSLGTDSFQVVTIGFDTANDSPERMQSFARSQGVRMANWRFLAIDGGAMHELARELGFIYFSSPRGFDHLAQVSVVDADGRLYRQVYGEDFATPFLLEPLKDLILGRKANFTSIDGLVNRLRLFCTVYDPSAGRYRFDYAVFGGFAIGLLALGGVGFVIVSNVWRLMQARHGRAG